ncbi:hypothetical protein PRK78_003685 [Emydomyces testavorans]|uniref:Ankyrin repeat protein n=1 Tax=Emydomyces testavorans TaxID=2070801 RepID=A0AAF0DGM5_9EURO|nr:hypothetical protein PRK78_003685 [Emydomyces testavorans]
MELPSLPLALSAFVPHLSERSRVDILNGNALKPFKCYESKLREIFAQEPKNKAIADPHINVVPVYAGHEDQLMVKARDLEQETPEEAEKYILPLSPAFRRESSTPAVVGSLDEFKDNFRLFSESSLVDLDWSNVVVAGSAVTTCLLPLSAQHKTSRKAQREFYHEKIAPASDVDLFIYGLDEEQAIEKIKQIEKCITNSILEETTVIRTKNALTIVSKYPTRHVQIVLRLYKSISEILTGFDVDCSCTAFDGSQVWASPRALASFVTQVNTIDLTRRSPSYENRLAKYSHRGFEVYWPNLERSRVDPTIFERFFTHVVGLARLLVMEKLPTASARESYIEQRRSERDRPSSTKQKFYHNYRGNLKEYQPEDVAEWVEDEDVSNYHTFTIPYGPKYSAKKIEKLLYKKDLLLNAEWNKAKERTVNLHRHPAFFGAVQHVIEDCCGFCPAPITDEELQVAEEESKRFISGKIQFMKDDPGRQTIGSFNPITDSDWTEMAYIGDTVRLCQAIAAKDLESVETCCPQEDFNVDKRDHTGRMPLHLAVMCSTPEIVQCLVNHGARLVARIAGGYTVLHLAAARGNPDILRIILRKSEANKAEHLEKAEKKTSATHTLLSAGDCLGSGTEGREDDNISIVQSVSEGPYAATEGSMVMVQKSPPQIEDPVEGMEDGEDEPNFYDNIDVLSWDTPISALHVALLNGHAEVVDIIATEFGANAALPIVWKNQSSWASNQDVTLSMALTTHHPLEKAKKVLRKLLELGASSTQADMKHITAFHSVVMEGEAALIDVLFELDGPAAQLAINHPLVDMSWEPKTALPLSTAVKERGVSMINKLLEHGASLSASSERLRRFWARRDKTGSNFSASIENHLAQPIIIAAQFASPAVIKALLDAGSDPNAITPNSHLVLLNSNRLYPATGQSLLDIVNVRIRHLRTLQPENKQRETPTCPKPPKLKPDGTYLKDLVEGSYEHCFVKNELERAKLAMKMMEIRNRNDVKREARKGEKGSAKSKWIRDELDALENVKTILLEKGARTFRELHTEYKEQSKLQANDSRRGFQTNAQIVTTEQEFTITRNFYDSELGVLDSTSYMQLFEAVWDGDIDKVKRLTLSSWGADQEKLPLRISVRDRRQLTPFAIAVARGHFELARVILEIVEAQYAPKSEAPTRKKYEIVVDAEENSEYSDSDSEAEKEDEHDLGVAVQFNLISEQHTIDDIRELGNIVKSSTSPSSIVDGTSEMCLFFDIDRKKDVLKKSLKNAYQKALHDYIYGSKLPTSTNFLESLCEFNYSMVDLLSYAVEKNAMPAVKFMVEQKLRYQKAKAPENESKFLSMDRGPFNHAMERGYTEILGYLISETGSEFPLRTLMKKAGVNTDSKPKYYQGLTVYGKKREDWAAENGYGNARYLEAEENLLLRAAFSGNTDSIKWFLSDIPVQKYKEFACRYADDKRLKSFASIPGGFEGVLLSWLNARRELALHCAVLSSPRKEAGSAHIELVLDAVPSSLNAKNKDGITPLHIAFTRRSIMAAKAIVKAGADQTARDNSGHNMLHCILNPVHILRSVSLFKALSEILDKEILRSLATQRSHVKPGRYTPSSWGMQTPLAAWLDSAGDSEAEVLQTILETTGGQELYVLDGQGNYPIHQVIRRNSIELARVMLKTDPSLSLFENATGVTPLELAENRFFDAVFSSLRQGSSILCTNTRPAELYDGTPSIYQPLNEHWSRREPNGDLNDIYRRENEDKPRFFMTKHDEADLYQLLRETVAKNQVKRKLISLQDANQLVKRLAGIKWKRIEEDRDEKREEQDEVGKYMRETTDTWRVKELLKREKKRKGEEDSDVDESE